MRDWVDQKTRTGEWRVDSVVGCVDEGRSTRSDAIRSRPAFKRLLDHAVSGRLDVIVVHRRL